MGPDVTRGPPGCSCRRLWLARAGVDVHFDFRANRANRSGRRIVASVFHRRAPEPAEITSDYRVTSMQIRSIYTVDKLDTEGA